MDEFFDIPTVLVIVVAIVVLFRLRSVLGTRTGNERTPLQRAQQNQTQAPKPANDEKPAAVRATALPLPPADAERRALKLTAEIEQLSHGDEHVKSGLQAIVDADPTFAPKAFLEGAKSAYEMIVMAFADGDRKTLKNLLSREVYDGFDAAISDRESKGEKMKSTFVGIDKAEITHAETKGSEAQITVRIISQLISATYDKSDVLIDGDAENVAEVNDLWTFARDTRSRDPNWKLVATESEHE